MDKDTWKIEKDLCRCCHSEGSFRNLAEPCTEMGEEEVYCDMLRDSFDIDLTPVPGNLCAPTYTICDTCIERLRDAAVFKKQVLTCEKKFREMYSRNVIIAPPLMVDVKQEPVPPEDYMKYELMPMDLPGDSEDDDKASLGIKSDDSSDEDDYKLSLLESKKRNKASQKKQKTTKTKKVPKKTKTKKEKDGEEGDNEEADPGANKKKEPKAWIYVPVPITEADYKQEGKEYICSRCDEPCSSKTLLKYHHMKTHYKGYGKYQCPICKATFKTRVLILDHKVKEHNVDNWVKCKACDSKFVEVRYLQIHLDSVHKLGPKLKCNVCDYETHNKSHITKHMIRHTSDRVHPCRFCHKTYKAKNTLRQHENIHLGKMNKTCKECGQGFVQKASLNYHMSKYHPDVNF